MKSKLKGLKHFFFCFALSGSVFAGAMGIIVPASSNHFEVTGALGVAGLGVSNGFLGVTSSETDRLVQTNRYDWNTFAGQLGLGYVFYVPGAQLYSEKVQWFSSLEPELNGYYLSRTNLIGEVRRFGSPNFNEMTYKIPVESYRLMFDTALTVASFEQYSLYAKGGVGTAWNRTSFRATDKNGTPDKNQHLNLNATHSSFAWEAGAGLVYVFNTRFALSLEYLYTDFGRKQIPANKFTGAIASPAIAPAEFELTSQAALLGLHCVL